MASPTSSAGRIPTLPSSPNNSGRASSDMARGIHCFRSIPYQRRRARRKTKLSTEARLKVLEVRRQRACLRCKLLKIEVGPSHAPEY